VLRAISTYGEMGLPCEYSMLAHTSCGLAHFVQHADLRALVLPRYGFLRYAIVFGSDIVTS